MSPEAAALLVALAIAALYLGIEWLLENVRGWRESEKDEEWRRLPERWREVQGTEYHPIDNRERKRMKWRYEERRDIWRQAKQMARERRGDER